MRFKPGDQVTLKEDKSWVMRAYNDEPTFGPRFWEVVTVRSYDEKDGYRMITLVEYPCNLKGPCKWLADCFEKVITDSQLEEELKSIETHSLV
jgi:hypothetical protein